MNEQELADLFSEQIDGMLQGQTPNAGSGIEDLSELLTLGDQLSQTQFQAGAGAQAAFHSQLANWFGLANGGSPMTILGLSRAWFISIVVTTVVIVGLGFIAVMVSTVVVAGPIVELPVWPTEEPTAEPTGEPTEEPTAEPTEEPTAEPTGEPTAEPTAEPTGEPHPIIIFISNLNIITLCQGAYTAQSTFVNIGHTPVPDAALVWEIIEGAEFVEGINVNSNNLEATPGNALTLESGEGNAVAIQPNFVNLGEIAAGQEVDFDLDVNVGDSWWEQPEGTEIRVRISIENRIEITLEDDEPGDRNRGHGNDPDGYDEDNPGRGRGNHRHRNNSSYSQVITIIREGSQWIDLTGPAHHWGDQSLLINGNVVVINECTGLPPAMPPGANVHVIGHLLPDGTFIAINITVINITIINGEFESGVPQPGGSRGGGSEHHGGGGGGGGSRGGGSRGGGSRGGSGGSGGS